MPTVKRTMLGLLFGLTTLLGAPTLAAAADLELAGERTPATAEQRRDARRRARESRRDDRNDELERAMPGLEDFQLEPERKGMYVGAGLYTGATVSLRGFIPSIGHRVELGAGVTDRLTLGVSGGIVGHQGMRKGTAGVADLVATWYPLYGLYGRVGFGVTSHAPWRTGDGKQFAALPRRAGVGGIAGIGWEFRPLEHMALALGVDYEGRVRADGLYTQGFLVSITIRGYFNPKKR
jgi:hypothetical protein